MAWVRLDDAFPEHPKVLAAGGDAAWLYICALAYSNRQLTDGFIPSAALARLSDRKRPAALAARLVTVGLWNVVPEGWVIHDFLAYQKPRHEVEDERQKARERMANNRAGSPNVQANNERTSEEVHRSSEEVRLTPITTQPPPKPLSLDTPPTTTTSYPRDVVVVLEAMTESEWADNTTTVTSEDAWKRQVGKRLENEWAEVFTDALEHIPTEGDTTLFELADQVFQVHHYRYKYPVLSRLGPLEAICEHPTPYDSSPDSKPSGPAANGPPEPSTNGARSSTKTAST